MSEFGARRSKQPATRLFSRRPVRYVGDMRRYVALVVVCVLTFAACTRDAGDVSSTSTPAPTSTTTTVEPRGDLPWWNDRVFYEIFVRSFKDSDGDGIGDFPGLTASLDYLNDGDPTSTDDLGITGIWLMPISPSPSYHGYDVTDYRAVNPEYGTMEQFTAFLDAAHERGIAVLIDLVINHTSVDHPWFVASAEGDPAYADWYLWSDVDPGTTAPWGAPAWHALADRYYFGLFWEGMPDLNLENPGVTAELRDIARFWIEDVGVDGFRLDAARHLIEDGDVVADTPATVAWLEGFNDYVHSVDSDALVLGEVWSPTPIASSYVPDALDLVFDFDISAAGARSVDRGDASIFDDALAVAQGDYPPLQYATFLTNHDMDRIMSNVGGSVPMAKLAATWLLTSAGVPFVYYGEEVGLQGVKPDERIRTPMPWNADPPGIGFTTGTPWEPVFKGYETFNVVDETVDPDSLLSHYRRLITYRSQSTALRRGDLVPVRTTDTAVTSYLRTVGDDHVLVVLNLGAEYAINVALTLDSGPLDGYQGVIPIVGPPAYPPSINASGGFDGYRPLESIPPFGFLVLEFSADPTPDPPPTTTTTSTTPPGANASDVAVISQLGELYREGRIEETLALLSEDAVFTTRDGTTIGLLDALPDEAGFGMEWDWSGDGTVTLSDVYVLQTTWMSITTTYLEPACAPSGELVVCDDTVSNVFADAAGLGPFRVRETWRVRDGLIVEIFEQEPDFPSADWEAGVANQFARYEKWVDTTYPQRYGELFRAPCCHGTTQELVFSRQSMEGHAELIPQWAASADQDG